MIFTLLLCFCGNKKTNQTEQTETTKKDTAWEYPFNGKNLDGWEKLGGDATYHVEGDMIVGITASPKDTSNTFLVTKKHYANFEMEFEVLLEVAPDNYHNSGVQIRSNSFPEYRNGRVHGYQVEIDPDTTARSGGIYDEGRRGWVHDLSDNPAAKKAFKIGEWNAFRVEAIGPHIKTWVNGVPATDYVDSMTASGFIGLQVHATDSEKPLFIKWKNIRIKEL